MVKQPRADIHLLLLLCCSVIILNVQELGHMYRAHHGRYESSDEFTNAHIESFIPISIFYTKVGGSVRETRYGCDPTDRRLSRDYLRSYAAGEVGRANGQGGFEKRFQRLLFIRSPVTDVKNVCT